MVSSASWPYYADVYYAVNVTYTMLLIGKYMFIVVASFCLYNIEGKEVDVEKSKIWGPGLSPHEVVLPARYFFIHAVDSNGEYFQESLSTGFSVHITGKSQNGDCKTWINILDRKDGSYIVRYKMYYSCTDLQIHVKYGQKHVGNSPFIILGTVHAESCYCPVSNFTLWLQNYCSTHNYEQITDDLKLFQAVNFTTVRTIAFNTFNNPGSTSVCDYVVKDNEVYRSCFGQHVGFKMFMDAILLSLARKVHLPDMELLVNLGDWPLVSIHNEEIFPIFSWCGSDDSRDIVMPTYDITEATLECMGRVMLDLLSVQGNNEVPWNSKIEKAFWRGRDSRRERLKLIEIAREHPELFNVSLTNFFFFRDEQEQYGPKQPHVSFFKFFDYKYQLNIDGTVAAYRFPYLLAGSSLVFKQDSQYYEHFYKLLQPWKHYIPFKSDLSDLVEKLLWAKANDAEAQVISKNGQKFSQAHLMPQDIICYHALLFEEWSKRLTTSVEILDGMEHVQQPVPSATYYYCDCLSSKKGNTKEKQKEEL